MTSLEQSKSFSMSTANLPNSFDTVTEAVAWLQQHGYQHDFNLDKDCITHSGACRLMPQEFEIDKTYRFEGTSNPDDEDVVYAISSNDGQIRGILTTAYGAYADGASDEMISKLAAR